MMKKIIAMILSVLTIVGCLAGCGGKANNGPQTGASNVEISYLNQGFGSAWLDEVVEAFNAKYPEYHAFVRSTADSGAATASFGMSDIDTTDIYIGSEPKPTKYVLPLDDFLKTTAEGDAKAIQEKFPAEYLEAMRWEDGHIYSVGMNNSVLSIVYNTELFAKAGITTPPRTSDELASVCAKLLDEDIVPMCHFMNGGYWWKMNHFWWGQYDSVETFEDFYANPTKDKFLAKDGRYKALKACEKIVTPEYTMTGSNTESHVSIQTKFLAGRAAMMVNASWLSTEMNNVEDLNKFDVMRPPMISSIVEKCTTVKNDMQLRKVIDGIDAVLDGEKTEADFKTADGYTIDNLTVSAEDWVLLYAARTTIYSDSEANSVFIPNYSDAQEGAQKFLSFCFSDEGYRIIADTLRTPMNLSLSQGEMDKTGYTVLQNSFIGLAEESEHYIFSKYRGKDRLFTDGGAWPFALESYFYVPMMSSRNESDRITAEDAWKYMTDVITDNYEGWAANVKGE